MKKKTVNFYIFKRKQCLIKEPYLNKSGRLPSFFIGSKIMTKFQSIKDKRKSYEYTFFIKK